MQGQYFDVRTQGDWAQGPTLLYVGTSQCLLAAQTPPSLELEAALQYRPGFLCGAKDWDVVRKPWFTIDVPRGTYSTYPQPSAYAH
jgi:hypothetical protein